MRRAIRRRTTACAPTASTWPELVNQFTNGREIFFPDRTHFLPMEIPEEVAKSSLEETDRA